MNILLADDHWSVRKGLKQLLEVEFPDAQFGEASSAPEALDLLSRHPWDVMVLDIFMPGRSGLEVLHELRQQYPSLPVLVLSSAPEEQLAMRVLKAGASGYINKRVAPEELVKAVRKLMAGGRYVSAKVAERLALEIGQPDPLPHETLSERESYVLRRLMAGKSIKEIAKELSVSAKTVSVFHTRIWEKLGVRNDIELVLYMTKHNFPL